MKKIRLIELLQTIKASIVPFLSIAMFVCLGVALFLGIQWSGKAIYVACDNYFQANRLHDVEIAFPLGITDEDVKAISATTGVADVDVGYTSYQELEAANTTYIFKMQSMTSKLDECRVVEGRLPKQKGELALLGFWAKEHEYRVGDTIQLKHDATDAEDADGMRLLTTDTFEIVGICDNPAYVFNDGNAIGFCNLGQGSIDTVAFTTRESFDKAAYGDGYPNVYLTVAGASEHSTFSPQYDDIVRPVAEQLSELGGQLADRRHEEIVDAAQKRIDKAKDQIQEGEKEIESGQKALDDGRKAISEGEKTIQESEEALESGKQELADSRAEGERKLTEARNTLNENQQTLEQNRREYADNEAGFSELKGDFASIEGIYDGFIAALWELGRLCGNAEARLAEANGAYDAYQASLSDPEATEEETDKLWSTFERSYGAYLDALEGGSSQVDHINDAQTQVAGKFDVDVTPVSHTIDAGAVTRENAKEELGKAAADLSELRGIISAVEGVTFEAYGHTFRLTEVRAGIAAAQAALDQAKGALEEAERAIETGWNQYYAGQRELEQKTAEAQRKLDDAATEIEEGKDTLDQRRGELEEGEQQIKDATDKLDVSKENLAHAEESLKSLVEYQWMVLPRTDNGSVGVLSLLSDTVNKVSWAMASLFVAVGMFVCYSSVARLVHEEITQIGTKKALGFREHEISRLYLSFSALAIVIGVVASIAVALMAVEGIIVNAIASNCSLPASGPFFDPVGLLAMGALESLLILGSTWFAIHTVMKRDALVLLSGESTAPVKPHFWEKWALWQRMSLYSQTIVNNVVNDKRRVAATLVGVIGCTSLIVIALTLNLNVAGSLTRHFADVCHYNAILYLDTDLDDAQALMEKKCAECGLTSTPAYMRRVQAILPDGTSDVLTLVVPEDEAAFPEFFQLNKVGGGSAELGRGIWLNVACEKVEGLSESGASIRLADGTGATTDVPIQGFFEFYAMSRTAVMSKEAYATQFEARPEPNVLLVNTKGASVDELRSAFKGSQGYVALANSEKSVRTAFNVLAQVLDAVVVIYLALSALMALMVLLNLDIMYVSEKKRELIVLRINGFTVKAAKSYISRDTIFLTIIGVLLGIVVGAFMGTLTVAALEPKNGYFVKDFNLIAAAIGSITSLAFSFVVLALSLRRIPRFDLTDINRF